MWYMIEGSYKGLCCILDTMDIQMWVQEDASPSSTFSRKHVSNSAGVIIYHISVYKSKDLS